MWIYILVGLVIALILILINIYGAYLMAQSASLKGYGKDLHAWAICFWLGIIGYLYIISLPDLIQQSQNQSIMVLLEKKEEN